MAIALRMAKRGLGTAAPNPSVGAVIADPASGELISRGWTQPGGRPHAEVEALRRAGDRARGATLYVTLEPCAHHGQTPPCADAVIAAGVSRVVVGIEDSDPRTAGQGIARLRAAGVAVDAGVMTEEARQITIGHILRVTERRPFVQVKLALAADGSVPRGKDGTPKWVTGEAARARGHLTRAEADAILIGAATVADDDPELTCRLPGLEDRSPVRIVLSSSLDLPLGAKLWRSAAAGPIWVFCAASADPSRRAALTELGAEVMSVSAEDGGVSLVETMQFLAGRGITRLLVEGGATVWRHFVEAGLVDEAVMFRAGKPEEAKAPTAPSLEQVLSRFLPNAAMTLAVTRRIGDDDMHIFRRL
jgi:diaminohydroxyphosphoribosylaminopyrimidine deaminase/5-amino-6-(5-phosphoribosylamino)uracil reductase